MIYPQNLCPWRNRIFRDDDKAERRQRRIENLASSMKVSGPAKVFCLLLVVYSLLFVVCCFVFINGRLLPRWFGGRRWTWRLTLSGWFQLIQLDGWLYISGWLVAHCWIIGSALLDGWLYIVGWLVGHGNVSWYCVILAWQCVTWCILSPVREVRRRVRGRSLGQG